MSLSAVPGVKESYLLCIAESSNLAGSKEHLHSCQYFLACTYSTMSTTGLVPSDHGATATYNWAPRALVELGRVVVELAERPQIWILVIDQLFEGGIVDR